LEVVDRIDRELDDKIKLFFSQSLDANVDATVKLAKQPTETVQEVMERTGEGKGLVNYTSPLLG